MDTECLEAIESQKEARMTVRAGGKEANRELGFCDLRQREEQTVTETTFLMCLMLPSKHMVTIENISS